MNRLNVKVNKKEGTSVTEAQLFLIAVIKQNKSDISDLDAMSSSKRSADVRH